MYLPHPQILTILAWHPTLGDHSTSLIHSPCSAQLSGQTFHRGLTLMSLEERFQILAHRGIHEAVMEGTRSSSCLGQQTMPSMENRVIVSPVLEAQEVRNLWQPPSTVKPDPESQLKLLEEDSKLKNGLKKI